MLLTTAWKQQGGGTGGGSAGRGSGWQGVEVVLARDGKGMPSAAPPESGGLS